MKYYLFFIAVLCFCNFTKGCVCKGADSTYIASEKSSAVVIRGVIVSAEIDTIYGIDSILPVFRMKYRADVIEKYKGKIRSKEVVFYSGLGFDDCGFPFVLGEDYLIFLQKVQFGIAEPRRKRCFDYSTSICLKNMVFKDVTDSKYLK